MSKIEIYKPSMPKTNLLEVLEELLAAQTPKKKVEIKINIKNHLLSDAGILILLFLLFFVKISVK